MVEATLRPPSMPFCTFLLSMLLSCGSPAPQTYVVSGEVLEVRNDGTVVIAHDDIEGFMAAMTMPFPVADASMLRGIRPGDKVRGQLVLDGGTRLTKLSVTSAAARVAPPKLAPGQAVPVGAHFPTTPIRLAQGGPLRIGIGQVGAVVLTFLYTRCPIPEYCPAITARMAALQPQLPPDTRIVAVTLDPEHDTRRVLADYGATHGAVPGRWDFGLVPTEVLVGLAEKAGLKSHGKGLGISHDILVLVLDQDGLVVARYRDLDWSLDDLLASLGTPP